MRSLFTCIGLLALAAGSAAARDESSDQLKAKCQNAPAPDRPSACIQTAQLELRQADKLYQDGNVDQARAAVEDVVSLSERASNAASETRKHLKNTEIAVRKMAEKLRDIKRSVSFEDQPPIEHAVQRLEDIRTRLLKEMFKQEKK